MDHTTVSSNLKKGKFLGSKDRIILCGNNPTTNVQIQYSSFVNGVEGKRQFQRMSEVSFGESCVDMELCGIPRLTKTFAAVAKTNRTTGSGSISLIDVETHLNTAQLHAQNEKDYALFDSFCPYTSLSFQPDLELLATGTESGEIILFDLYAGREVSRIRADPTGVHKLSFMPTGQLVSIGCSEKSQIKIWDLKMKNSTRSSAATSPKRSLKSTSASQILSLSQEISHSTRSSPSNSPVGRSGSSSPFSSRQNAQVQYTCVSPHPIHERVVCGTNTGSIVVWDLRNLSGSSMEFQPHQSRGD
jgi:WD40 repeat protein